MSRTDINVVFPDIDVKIVPINSNIEKIVSDCEVWASKVLGKPFRDDHNLSAFCSYTLPNCLNTDRMTSVAKITIFFFLYDDLLEKNPDQINDWINVFTVGVHPTGDRLTEMFNEVWADIRSCLSETQQNRFIGALLKYLNSFIERKNDTNSYTTDSPEDYLRIRRNDSGVDVIRCLSEYVLEVSLDDSVLEHYLVRMFYENLFNFCCIVNDIVSFKKEYLDDGASFNYVSIINRLHGGSFQESVDFIGKQLKLIETNVLMYRDEIVERKMAIPANYMNDMIEAMYGCYNWHINSNRYK